VLFIFSQDHTLRIEVGYGLESKVPDVLASRIIRQTIAPELRAGEPDRAVRDGIDKILQLIEGGDDANTGEIVPPAPLSLSDRLWNYAILGVLLSLIALPLFLIVLAIGGAIRPGFTIGGLSFPSGDGDGGGGGGFSGGGGGGFSGGGGSSGGGGASGSW
jgi:uncharacterized protein